MELAAVEVLLRAALALPHAVGDLERVLEHLEPLRRARPGEPETLGLGLVPGGADAEPGPAAGQDVERRRGLDPQARVAVVDAADHQPEPGPLAVGGHEPERRPALEHRLELRARPADLPEVVHHPDGVEADLVGRPDGAGEGRPDRLRSAGPGERVDLESELHDVVPFVSPRQAAVARSRASISAGVSEKARAPALSAAWRPFLAPGIGRTSSFSMSQRSATWAGLRPWASPISRSSATTGVDGLALLPAEAGHEAAEPGRPRAGRRTCRSGRRWPAAGWR